MRIRNAFPESFALDHVLTVQATNSRDMLAFKFKCFVLRDSDKSAMKKRACDGIIIGKDKSTKGFRFCLKNVTHHMQSIRTLDKKLFATPTIDQEPRTVPLKYHTTQICSLTPFGSR